MKNPPNKLLVALCLALLALTLTGTSALAEEEAGIIAPEGKGSGTEKVSSGGAGPKTVDYGPGHGMRRPGMRNAPVGPGTAHQRYVTPYGDFCPLCTTYGVGRKAVGLDHALNAMKDYFARRGFEIRNVHGVGRFLKADVFKEGRLVDKVLFDRRTGRIRSIF